MDNSKSAIRKWKRHNKKSRRRINFSEVVIPDNYNKTMGELLEEAKTTDWHMTPEERYQYGLEQEGLIVISTASKPYKLLQGIQALENLMKAGFSSFFCYITPLSYEEWVEEVQAYEGSGREAV